MLLSLPLSHTTVAVTGLTNEVCSTDKYIISPRGTSPNRMNQIFANEAWFVRAVTLLPTGDWSVGIEQARSTTAVNHRTSRPLRETSPDSERSPSHFCHFVAGPLNPSSWLPPAGVSTTHQMAPLAWKTFTLSVWTWQICCQAFTSLQVWRWHGGSAVGTVISQRQGSVLVSLWTVYCFALCLCGFPATSKTPVSQMD